MIESIKNEADRILKYYGIDSPDKLNLADIANGERLIIDEEDLKTHEGRIMKGKANEYGVITINSNIREPGQKRFVIAHELGHYLLSQARQNYCSRADIRCYLTKKRSEIEANEFAGELLMPEKWVEQEIKWNGEGIDVMKQMSEKFGVSLSAAGIRYTQVGKMPIAVIATKDNKVIWSSVNGYFPFRYIRWGQRVNSHSDVFVYNRGETITKEPHEIMSNAWFQNDFNFVPEVWLTEQNLVMPKYGMVLTVVWEGKNNDEI